MDVNYNAALVTVTVLLYCRHITCVGK